MFLVVGWKLVKTNFKKPNTIIPPNPSGRGFNIQTYRHERTKYDPWSFISEKKELAYKLNLV
jgi:hypothetical protein